jgi:predicted secreted protein
MMKTLPILLGLLLSVALPVRAAEPQETLFDTVSLSTQAEAEVDNDRVETVLFAEREGNDPKRLADAVNHEMDWALQQLKGASGIQASTPAYHTFPIYQQGRITGWRVRQTLRLTSSDSTAMSAMLGKLQARLKLQAVGFVLSPEQRRKVEERLTREALTRFSERAAMIAKQLGRNGYRLVSMKVNGSGSIPPRPQMAVAAMRSDAMVAAPRLEGGRSEVRVTVSGTIQLKD